MKLKFLSQVRAQHPDFAPRCRSGQGDVLLDNDPYNQVLHVVVCDAQGAPLYDVPARAEPRGAIALAVDRQGRLGLLEQWRAVPAARPWQSAYPAPTPARHGFFSWEVPRGFPDAQESSLQAARREVGEELGCRAVRAQPLGWCNLNTTFSLTDLPIYLVLVDRDQADARHGDDPHESIRQVRWWEEGALRQAIARGELRCGVTLAALARLWSDPGALERLLAQDHRPHRLDARLGELAAFVESIHARLWERGVHTGDLLMDHLCYRAADKEEYKALRQHLALHADLLVEGMIRGRPISTWSLHRPVQAAGYTVDCLELAAPAPDKQHSHGLEHAELVLEEPLEAFLARHPGLPWRAKALGGPQEEASLPLGAGLQVKLHRQPLRQVIAQERAQGLVVPVPQGW